MLFMLSELGELLENHECNMKQILNVAIIAFKPQ